MTVETHLLDQEIELYGERIELIFRERLRGEKTFPDAAALRAQIAQDIGRARRWFANVGYTPGVSERVSAAPKARRER
jgi:FAD synthase